MSALCRIGTFGFLLVLGATEPAAGQTPARLKACISIKGLSPEATSATKTGILKTVQGLGLAVIHGPEEAGESGCCSTAGCLQEEASRHAVAVVLDVNILRFGPVVRITVRTFDTATNAETVQVATTAAAATFPGKSPLQADLLRALKPYGARAMTPGEGSASKAATDQPVALPSDVAPSKQPKKTLAAVDPPPPPPAIFTVETNREQASRRSAYQWAGWTLTGGGAAFACVGAVLLLGPMKSNLDQRNRDFLKCHNGDNDACNYWPDDDHKAYTYYIAGWVGTSLGAAMLVSGVATLLLSPPPASEAAPDANPQGLTARPMILPSGGGLVLGFSW